MGHRIPSTGYRYRALNVDCAVGPVAHRGSNRFISFFGHTQGKETLFNALICLCLLQVTFKSFISGTGRFLSGGNGYYFSEVQVSCCTGEMVRQSNLDGSLVEC